MRAVGVKNSRMCSEPVDHLKSMVKVFPKTMNKLATHVGRKEKKQRRAFSAQEKWSEGLKRQKTKRNAMTATQVNAE